MAINKYELGDFVCNGGGVYTVIGIRINPFFKNTVEYLVKWKYVVSDLLRDSEELSTLHWHEENEFSDLKSTYDHFINTLSAEVARLKGDMKNL